MGEISKSRYLTNAGWDDVPHLTDADKAEIIDLTPAHLIDAARYGIPTASVGRILPWDFKRIECEPFIIPKSWPRVYGFDPSVNRTAAVFAARDEENDIVYLYGEYLQTHQITRQHAAVIQMRGAWLTGLVDPSAEGKILDGRKVIDIYKGHGLNLVKADNAVQAGIQAMIDRVTTGRLRVFPSLPGLHFEWNQYRRDDKQAVVKVNDDRLDCVRYICLDNFRHATVNPEFFMRAGQVANAVPSIADTRAGY